MDSLTVPFVEHAQNLLDNSLVIWLVARSHLLIAVLVPLFLIGLVRLHAGKSFAHTLLVALGVIAGITYLYAEFLVGGVGPVCCFIRADMDWQNTQASGWMGIFVISLVIIACFRLATLGNHTTRAVLHISGWLAIVIWFSTLFFTNATYITGALVFIVELTAAVAIVYIITMSLISAKRNRASAEATEKARFTRDNPEYGTSEFVHRDDR